MTESAFNRPVPVQEQQAALKAEPKPTDEPSNEGEKPEVLCLEDEMLRIARDLQAREEAALAAMAVPLQPDRGHQSTHPNFPNGIDIPGVGTIPVHSTSESVPIEDARELTAEEASRALEAAMQERIAEAIDNDLETRARIAAIPAESPHDRIKRGVEQLFEGTFQGDPIISNPAMPPGVVARVRLTAEQLEATKHLKPGEAFAKAVAGIGESLGGVLEPEPAKKPEDLDGF